MLINQQPVFFHWFVLTSGKILAASLVWINYRTGRESISKIKSTGLLSGLVRAFFIKKLLKISGETHFLSLINTCKIDTRHLQLFLVEDDPQGRNDLSKVFRISLSQSQHFMNAQEGRKDDGNEVVKRTLTLRKRKDLGPDHEALLSYDLS